MNINKKLMRKWVDKLRSREYKQGTRALRRKGPTARSVDRFCCLGVLCDIYNSKGWVADTYKSDDHVYYKFPGKQYGVSDVLATELLDKIGLSPDEQQKLIGMNDHGKKFHEIANYLEKKYLS